MKHICKSLKNIQKTPPVYKISSISSYITTFINRDVLQISVELKTLRPLSLSINLCRTICNYSQSYGYFLEASAAFLWSSGNGTVTSCPQTIGFHVFSRCSFSRRVENGICCGRRKEWLFLYWLQNSPPCDFSGSFRWIGIGTGCSNLNRSCQLEEPRLQWSLSKTKAS